MAKILTKCPRIISFKLRETEPQITSTKNKSPTKAINLNEQLAMNTITPYDVIGGEQAILSLVERFYFYMDILPEAQGIRAMHQPNLDFRQDQAVQVSVRLARWSQFIHRRIRPPDAARPPFAVRNWRIGARPVDAVHE